MTLKNQTISLDRKFSELRKMNNMTSQSELTISVTLSAGSLNFGSTQNIDYLKSPRSFNPRFPR